LGGQVFDKAKNNNKVPLHQEWELGIYQENAHPQ
jgi:hypothetical protein